MPAAAKASYPIDIMTGDWRLGAFFGAIYLAALLAMGTPWLFAIK